MTKEGLPLKRMRLAAGGFVALAILAGATQARVQLLDRGRILTYAEQTKRYVVGRTDFARRGVIYSSDGKLLAQSDDAYELALNFRKVPSTTTFFMDLADASGIPAGEFARVAASGVRSRIWKVAIDESQASAIQQTKTDWRADGISLTRVMRREYPLAEAASGIVGNVLGGAPVAGLELSQNKVLEGLNGYREGMVDQKGSFLPMRMTRADRKRVDGKDVVLTIDSTLQAAASDAVRMAVTSNKASSGCAIVMDPSTGDILAMANWPSYNPDAFDLSGPEATGFDMAYMGAYEPGSTFKILTLAKALDEGVINDGFTKLCTGVLRINSAWRIRCDQHNGTRAHGLVDLQKAIAKSCNVSAATWALKLGYERMSAYLDELGLLQKTSVGLPLERGGSFNRNDYAKLLQISNVGFGQAVTTTPLALAGAFSMLGNGGKRVVPRLIKSIGGKPIPQKPQVPVVAPQTAAKVMKLMEAVIQTDAGTGKSLRIPGYMLAGKTGTAQKTSATTHKVGGGYVSSFVGFVPSVKPEALILVMIDNPKGGQYYGALVAGPVFLSLAKTVIRYRQIPPTVAAG